MYHQFFDLEKNPFSITPDPNFLFLTGAHREALAALLFAITCRKGFLVLTGDAGTGKTTLLRTILRRVSPDRTLFSLVVHPTLSTSEFLEYTLLDFGLKDIPASKAQRLNLFHQFLVRSAAEGKTPVLVVDEAHKLSPELLEEIRLLTNAETAEQKLLQIILAGQNELTAVLARDDMRQLRQRIAVRVSIGPLNRNDLAEYMQTRWLRAGSSQPLPFTSDAMEAIAYHSAGIPRVINAISDAALISAFATESRTIAAAQIHAAAKDLQLTPNHSVVDGRSSLATSSALRPPPPSLASPVALNDHPFKTLERYAPRQDKRPGFMRWLAGAIG